MGTFAPRTTPSNPNNPPTPGELAVWTLEQHWIGPVLHRPLGGAEPPERKEGTGLAAARMEREKRRESLKSIVSELIVNELGLESDGYKSRVFIRKIRGQGALAQDVSKETTVHSVSCQEMPQKYC